MYHVFVSRRTTSTIDLLRRDNGASTPVLGQDPPNTTSFSQSQAVQKGGLSSVGGSNHVVVLELKPSKLG